MLFARQPSKHQGYACLQALLPPCLLVIPLTPLYSILILLASLATTLGITMFKIPFFKLAFTAS